MENSDARIIFFGFSDVGYKCLKYLLDEGCNVAAVFTHDTDPHEAHWFETPESLAKENCIPVFKPETLKTEKWARKVKYLKPDLILSLYYRNLIPEDIFKEAKLGAYNMHGSYLPSYRGRAPLNWSIINGENYCGASLHVLEKKFDTGGIIAQEKVEFGDDEYVGDIQPRISVAALNVLKKALPLLLAGNPPFIEQDLTKVSYFGKRTPEDGRIDFTKTARQVFNLIRGVSKPFPGAFTDVTNPLSIIWRAHIGGDCAGITAGTVTSQTPLTVACADKFIIADEVETVCVPAVAADAPKA